MYRIFAVKKIIFIYTYICAIFLCSKRRLGNIMNIIAGMKKTVYSLPVRVMNPE